MNYLHVQIGWVDFLVLLLIAVGLARGRKRGMSEEVLDLVKWVVILVSAGHFYRPMGHLLADMTVLGHLTCYVAVYATIIIILHATFSFIRSAIGQKLVTSDAFGGGEYYMGMVAGALRYFCVLVVCFAFLNARQYTPDEIKAEDNFQENNFGSIRLPTLSRLQRAVFEDSFSGGLARNYLATYLISSTAPEDKALGGGKTIYGRGRNFNEVLEKR